MLGYTDKEKITLQEGVIKDYEDFARRSVNGVSALKTHIYLLCITILGCSALILIKAETTTVMLLAIIQIIATSSFAYIAYKNW